MSNRNTGGYLSRALYRAEQAPKVLFILIGAAGAWALIALIVQLTYAFAI